MGGALVYLVILVPAAIVLLLLSVRIVGAEHVALIERLGRFSRTLAPGVHLLVPLADRVKRTIDMREQLLVFASQHTLLDEERISFEVTIEYTVVDPQRATYAVARLEPALTQLTMMAIQNAVGAQTLAQVRESGTAASVNALHVLDEGAGPWGLRINRLDLREVEAA